MVNAARTDSPAAARATVEQAIQAHGGANGLTRCQFMTRKATGVLSLFGQAVTFTDEMIVQLPERLRLTIEAESSGNKMKLIQVINGSKGWLATGAGVTELSKERLAELQEDAYVLWLTTLTPLTKGSDFTLAALPEVKLNGQAVAGVKVSRKGHEDVKLYFDKESGLLVKVERRAREAGLLVVKEQVYAGHKAVDGVRLPTKFVEFTNGKKFVDASNLTYRFLDKVDDNTFAKP
jgi:hypothetical protein